MAQPIRADVGRVGGFILRLVLGLVVVVAVGYAVKLIGEGIQLSRPGFYVDVFDVVTGGLYADEVY